MGKLEVKYGFSKILIDIQFFSNKGYAFIEYKHHDDAKDAVKS